MRWIYSIVGVAVVVAAFGYFYVQQRLAAPLVSEAAVAQLKSDAAAEDESAFDIPDAKPAAYPAPNPLKNVYFGDLHTHSNLSFDAYIFGTRLTVDQAYRIAKGEAVVNTVGNKVQLATPLDFAAVTDHAEGFGMHESCDDPEITKDTIAFCKSLEQPDVNLFLRLREQGEKRPPARVTNLDPEKDRRFAQSTWAKIVAVAEDHNEPGKFTTFAAYEYSPPLPDSGKIHRNVIFRNNTVPVHAVSAFDALTEIDLWEQLRAGCTGACEFLTIPHNPNKTWGLAFASHTIDGDPYTVKDWKTRDALEPLVEMFQIKGNSECSVGFGTSDEECNHEQFLPRCKEGQETGCIHPTSMARDGLKKGLLLEEEMGFNPLDFGMIGSTDTHNSNPGDTEEWDFRGMSGLFSMTAKKRLSEGRGGNRANLERNPGGLAAVWAPENTRDALFEAMQRKEVYATSGTRIRLRFFGSFGFADGLADSVTALESAYADGVPMGSTLKGVSEGAPSFLIWASRDPLNAPLDKIQIIKGWTQDGEVKESVYDVLCSEGRTVDPQTRRCATTTASVDLSNCDIDQGRGAAELKTVWTDPSYGADQNAVYYVRVIQNPTCRWSTYDSLRLGEAPPEGFPATSTEMAWSSPIWISNK